MRILTGIAAAGGIAIGRAMLIDHEDLTVPAVPIAPDQVAAEILRFEDALTKTRTQILKIQHQITQELGR